MADKKRKERPEAIVRLEEVWPKLDEQRKLKLEALSLAAAFLVESDPKKEGVA